MTSRTYELGSEKVHTRWKPDLEPLLEVDPGDTVLMACREGFDGQIDPPVRPDEVEVRLYSIIDFRRLAPVTGPIAIRGAEPGDTLEVRILDLSPFGVGNLLVFPAWAEFDFLRREQRKTFPRGWMRRFDMKTAVQQGFVQFAPGVRVALRPMLGVAGTAPAEGDFSTTGPPWNFGGNMDVRDIAAGSKLYLPVLRLGAMFSAGDGHAVQGDGEICTTGLETPMRATLQFHLHKRRTISAPQIETQDEFMTVAYGRTVDEAARCAIADMVEYLAERQGLEKHEAYGLLSLAGDIRVNQVVDFPHLGARVAVRTSLFDQWRW